MSRRRNVILAVKAMVKLALPLATVRGFDTDSRARAVPIGGVVVGSPGDPGEPDVILSPLSYVYEHPLAIEVAPTPGGDQAAMLDDMLASIGRAIDADRTLGGACDWIEATAPVEDDVSPDGAASQRWATIDLVVTYTTTSPLG